MKKGMGKKVCAGVLAGVMSMGGFMHDCIRCR